MKYLHWDEQTITDFSDENVAGMYDRGYLFTRIGKGVMHQTRSARVDLSKFELSSENRRILKKADPGVFIVPPTSYAWEIGKMASDFYGTKFGPGIINANTAKRLVTNADKSSFNYLIGFEIGRKPLGYAICYKNTGLIHYCYPFYDMKSAPRDMGLGMMINTSRFSKDNGLQYIYLGSLQRGSDAYKLQFQGLEWFDGNGWSNDVIEAKRLLSTL